MTDLIENKARQLEHDAKNLEDEDENLSQTPISSKDLAPKPTAKRPTNTNDDKTEKGGPGKYRIKFIRTFLIIIKYSNQRFLVYH